MNKMLFISEQFSLENISTYSFGYQLDNRTSFSNLDLCFVANKILHFPDNFQNKVLKLDSDPNQKSAEIFRLNSMENYWVVYNEILGNKTEYILRGIECSIESHTELIRLVYELLQKNKIESSPSFSYVILSLEMISSRITVSY